MRLCADAAAPGLSPRNDDAGGLVTSATCPARDGEPYGGLLAAVRARGTAVARGATAAWTVTAPPGTSLRALTVRRDFHRADADYEVTVRTAEGAVLDLCPIGCPPGLATVTYPRLETAAVTFAVTCTAALCGTSEVPRAWLVIREATATLDDPTPPVVEAPATGWQRTGEVAIAAHDASGVRRVALAGGATLDQTCDYTHLQPCPGTVRTSLATDLPDGVHALTAVATDAAGQESSVPVTLRLDRRAPGPPVGLTIQQREDGAYVYAWSNPDQAGSAPIVAAHMSDGTVVRGAGVERLEARTGDGRVWLEDEAGNADPASAAGPGGTSAVGTQDPILRPSGRSLKVLRPRRSGRVLVVRGTVAGSAKVRATLTRGRRVLRASAKPRNGRFTIRIRLTPALRRAGTNVLTVRYGDLTVRQRLRFR